MTSGDWLHLARLHFSTGKSLYVVRDGDPYRLQRRLYKAARLRGYGWRFKRDDDRVVIYRGK